MGTKKRGFMSHPPSIPPANSSFPSIHPQPPKKIGFLAGRSVRPFSHLRLEPPASEQKMVSPNPSASSTRTRSFVSAVISPDVLAAVHRPRPPLYPRQQASNLSAYTSQSAPSSPPSSCGPLEIASLAPSSLRHRLTSDPAPSPVPIAPSHQTSQSAPSSQESSPVAPFLFPQAPSLSIAHKLPPLPPAYPRGPNFFPSLGPVTIQPAPANAPLKIDLPAIKQIAIEDEHWLNDMSCRKLYARFRKTIDGQPDPSSSLELAALFPESNVENSQGIVSKEDEAKALLQEGKEKEAFTIYRETALWGSVDAYQKLARNSFKDVKRLAEWLVLLPPDNPVEIQELIFKRLQQGILFYREPTRCGNSALDQDFKQDLKDLLQQKLPKKSSELLKSMIEEMERK